MKQLKLKIMLQETTAEVKHEYESYLDECWLHNQSAIPFEEFEKLYNNGELYLLD